ncbi:MAG: hypothetical protein J1F17_04185 [Oscillospiraceae bacterium]|nr:hypothetical protein [Oscillospiraceae bacterium]
MRYSINLLNEPNQSLNCNLTDDAGNIFAVDINLRTLSDGGLIADIIVDGTPQRYGVMCNNNMPLLSSNILGGNLYFQDQCGNEDPYYEDFNDKFLLIYDSEYRLG